MSRKVLDSNLSDADIDNLFDGIIAQNPQLNAQIEQVRNSSNIFLCEVLRIYSYEDKALVKILDNGKNIFCRLSHEILGNGMSVDFIPNGIEKIDNTNYVGKTYIKPYDSLYGIVLKVRWENLKNENVLLGYVNVHDEVDLRSSSDKGELSIKSGSSTLSVDDERINIMTPSLFINGLPYDEPDLKNYYDKNELNVITNALQEQIKNTTNNTIQKIDYSELINAYLEYNQLSNDEYTLFRGDCWTINNNFESSASITSTDYDNFTVMGTFRTDSDLVGIYWNSKDLIQHPYISYGEKYDYTGVTLEFDYTMSGCRAWTDGYNETTNPCVITINKTDGTVKYALMRNYITNNHVEINFDNLRDGENNKISVKNIESIMLMLKPSIDGGDYNIINNVDFNCDVTNIRVTKGKICNEHKPLKAHNYRICEGYDDFYNFNPKRITHEMRKLGYVEWCDLYIGASHYYEKSGDTNERITSLDFDHTRTEKMVLNPNVPLNRAFSKWLDCYSKELKANGTKNLVISVSMENLQPPTSWRQKQAQPSEIEAVANKNPNGYALTGWIPSTFFYSPCNENALEYMKTVSEACLDIVVGNDMPPILQLGEAWWWWNENDIPRDGEGNPTCSKCYQPPCFYDDATKEKYRAWKGKDMPEYTSSWETSYDKSLMQWLNRQLVLYSEGLRKVIKKSKYNNGLYMALFFPPSVLDKDRVPQMIQEVNYLSKIYSPSHIDVLQVEDYDWVTGRENVSEELRVEDRSHHPEAYTIGEKLGFNVDKQHYFGGFVQYEKDAVEFWNYIKKSMDDAFSKGFKEVFVWAGSQVRRDNKFIGHDVFEFISKLNCKCSNNGNLTNINLEDYIKKSSTTGLVKNDGSIDENDYITSSELNEILSSYSTPSLEDYALKSELFSGSYNDLTDKPTLFSGSYNDLTDKPTLFSGSYNDLTNKPTLFSGDYNDLSNKPTIPSDVSQLTDNQNTSFTPKTHTHNVSDILDFPSIEPPYIITPNKGVASQSTLNKFYIEVSSNKTDVYYTIENNNSYSWKKLDSDILDDLNIDWLQEFDDIIVSLINYGESL